MTDTERQVVGEMIRAMEILGAQSDLLCIVGSFQETLPDEMVLEGLREWNSTHREDSNKSSSCAYP
jgi:hypothetical protein